MEPDNEDRAGFACTAVEAYAAITRFDPREQKISVDGPEDTDGREHAEEVMSDLLGDMRHLAKSLGIDWDTINERGAGHFEYESEEEYDLKGGES
jgi:hypothetical protein